MNISSLKAHIVPTNSLVRNLKGPEGTDHDPKETFHPGRKGCQGPTKVLLMSAAGFVPVVGAVSNVLSVVGAGLNNQDGLSYLNLGGAAANLVGTASLAGGLFTGNSTATRVGLGLLGASALTVGITESYLCLRGL